MSENNEQLYSQFADIAALDAQKKSVIDIFLEIKQGIIDLQEAGIKIEKSTGLKSLGEGLKKQKKATDELTLSVEEYNNILTHNAKLEAQIAALQTGEAKTLAELRVQRRLANKELEAEAKITQTLTGTLENIRARKNALIAQRDKIQIVDENSQRQVELLNKRIDNFDQIIKKNSSTVEKFKQNVGNYAGSLADSFELVRREISRLQREQKDLTIGGDTRGAEAAGRRISELDNIVKVAFDNTKSYTLQVRELEKQYINLATSGQQSEEFLREFKNEVGNAKDAANDLRESIKLAASDTRSLDVLIGAGQAIAGGFAVAQGTAALFGDENEDLQKTLVKLNGVMAILNGLQAIQNELKKKDNILTIAQVGLQKAYALAVGTSTGAMKIFRIALAATGVGLLVIGIGALIAKLSGLGGASKKTASDVDILTVAFENQNRVLDQNRNKIDNDTKKKLNAAKELGASERELANITLEGLVRNQISDRRAIEERKKTYKGFFDAQGNNIAQFVNNSKEATKTLNEIDVALLNPNLSKKRKADLEASKKFTEQLRTDYQNFENSTIAIAEHAGGRRAKNAEDRRAKDKEQAEKHAEDLASIAERNREAQFSIDSEQLGRIATNAEEISKADQEVLHKRLESFELFIDAKRSLIDMEAAFEKNKKGLTAKEIEAIDEKHLTKRLELEKQASLGRIAILEAEKRIRKELLESRNQKQAEDLDKSISDLETAHNKQLNQAATFRDELLRQNQDAFNAGITNEKSYNKRKIDIQEDYELTILSSQIDFFEAQMKLLRAFGKDVTELEAAIAEARKKISETKGKDPGLENDRQKNIRELTEFLSEAQDKYAKFAEFTSGTANAIADRQKNAIQEQIDEIERQKQADIDRIMASTDSEEQKAAKVKVIEAKAAADREKLEKKKRDADYRAAVVDKALTIMRITLANALAIAQAIPKGPQAVLSASILGAAQLAIAIATPVPRFAKGKKADDPYEGPGIVGEAGREIGISRSGKATLYTGPTLTQLMKGDVILPNQVTEDLLRAVSISTFVPTNRTIHREPEVTREMFEMQLEILKRIERKNMGPFINHIDMSPYYYYHMKQ